MSKIYLPLSRPFIDEETIAGVAEVLALGLVRLRPAGEGVRVKQRTVMA
jgi:hypothetical protein